MVLKHVWATGNKVLFPILVIFNGKVLNPPHGTLNDPFKILFLYINKCLKINKFNKLLPVVKNKKLANMVLSYSCKISNSH